MRDARMLKLSDTEIAAVLDANGHSYGVEASDRQLADAATGKCAWAIVDWLEASGYEVPEQNDFAADGLKAALEAAGLARPAEAAEACPDVYPDDGSRDGSRDGSKEGTGWPRFGFG